MRVGGGRRYMQKALPSINLLLSDPHFFERFRFSTPAPRCPSIHPGLLLLLLLLLSLPLPLLLLSLLLLPPPPPPPPPPPLLLLLVIVWSAGSHPLTAPLRSPVTGSLGPLVELGEQ